VLLSVVIAAGLLAATVAQRVLEDYLLAFMAGALAIITLAPMVSRLAVDGTASRRVS
jgi:zinc transporter ZupT